MNNPLGTPGEYFKSFNSDDSMSLPLQNFTDKIVRIFFAPVRIIAIISPYELVILGSYPLEHGNLQNMALTLDIFWRIFQA